ncbi:MAG: 6-pyruvoyl-tetrahydropterin synthase-related protein [Candidatus Beckwithbacteria bacterium]
MMFIKKLFKLVKNNWPVILILCVSLFLLRWFVKPGFPETHDGQLYLARFANFYLAVRDHHFPIRWAPNLEYKFGYPVFNFNYYTPFAVGLIATTLGADFETGLKFVIFLSFFVGGLFWYLLFKKKFSKSVGLVSALVYLSAPYQMLDILVRCSIGEVVSLGLLPFILWAVDKLITKLNRLNFIIATLGLAFFSITHNIIFFFSTPVLILFSIFTSLSQKKFTLKKFSPIIISFLIAFGLTQFFWTPALLEKKYTNIDQLDQMNTEYLDHFPTFKQLIYSPWGSGYSYKGPDDQMSFQIGPIHWIISILAIGFILLEYKKSKSKKNNHLKLFFSLLFITSVFFLTPASIGIWKLLPLVNYVQFPWRLLTFAILASAGLAGLLASLKPKLTWFLVILSLVYITLLVKPNGWFNHDDHFYFEYPFNTSIMGANTPIWFNENHNIFLDIGHMNGLQGVSTFQEITWITQKHVYKIDAAQDTQVLERTMYFPGWEVKVDGVKADIDYQKNEYPGLITFKVPAGKHTIISRFTENTRPRIIGDTISLLSLAILLMVLKSKKLFKKS